MVYLNSSNLARTPAFEHYYGVPIDAKPYEYYSRTAYNARRWPDCALTQYPPTRHTNPFLAISL